MARIARAHSIPADGDPLRHLRHRSILATSTARWRAGPTLTHVAVVHHETTTRDTESRRRGRARGRASRPTPDRGRDVLALRRAARRHPGWRSTSSRRARTSVSRPSPAWRSCWGGGRALEALRDVEPPRSVYLDLLRPLPDAQEADNTPFTPAVQVLARDRAGPRRAGGGGVAARHLARYAENARVLRDGMARPRPRDPRPRAGARSQHPHHVSAARRRHLRRRSTTP